jgi:hypothetical protein
LCCGKHQEHIHVCKLGKKKSESGACSRKRLAGVVSYVEQARIVRIGLGGLDGETGRALREQELPAELPGSARVALKTAEQIHVASFFDRDLTINADYGAFDQGCCLTERRREEIRVLKL